MANNYDELTEKQKRFIDYYIETSNAAESARRAGYSEKTADRIGHENLKKLEKYIQERLEELKDDRIASAKEVLQYFTTIMRDKKEDTNDRTKCAELLGKKHGIFKEEFKIETDKPFEVNITVKKE